RGRRHRAVRERLPRRRGRAAARRRLRFAGPRRIDRDPPAGHGRRRTAAVTTVQELYGELWAKESGLQQKLARSLDPRGTDSLFDVFASLGPQPGQVVLDAGCRDAGHAIELVRRHGLRAIAVDPVPHHVELARRGVAAAGLEDAVDVREGAIESLPVADASVDWIWCRDVLVHVVLEPGLAECARVLRPGGNMLVYATPATPL